MAYIALVAAQLLYTVSDVWKKVIFKAGGFSVATLIKPAFIAAMVLAGIGFLFQMYTLSKIDLSRTIISMGMMAVVFSACAGVFYLKESLTPANWIGVVMALAAIMLVNWR